MIGAVALVESSVVSHGSKHDLLSRRPTFGRHCSNKNQVTSAAHVLAAVSAAEVAKVTLRPTHPLTDCTTPTVPFNYNVACPNIPMIVTTACDTPMGTCPHPPPPKKKKSNPQTQSSSKEQEDEAEEAMDAQDRKRSSPSPVFASITERLGQNSNC